MDSALNDILVRNFNISSNIHVQYYPKEIVPKSNIDWGRRLNFIKYEGRIKPVKEIYDEEFVSFPLYQKGTLFSFNRTNVVDRLKALASDYDLLSNVNVEYYPYESAVTLYNNNVNLSKLSDRISNVFGKGSKDFLELIEPNCPKIGGLSYKRINLGSLLGGRFYKLGESFP